VKIISDFNPVSLCNRHQRRSNQGKWNWTGVCVATLPNISTSSNQQRIVRFAFSASSAWKASIRLSGFTSRSA
jgi:hypothetical protein